MQRILTHSFAGAIAALMAGYAQATPGVSVVAMGLDQGNVTAQLEHSSQYFVNAMRRLITQSYPDQYRAIRWEYLEEAMLKARIARFEYRYTASGTEHVRVYHAMDGRPLSMVAEDIFSGTTPRGSPTPPRSPGTPGSPMPHAADFYIDTDIDMEAEGPASNGSMVDADVGDDMFYTDFDALNVRSRVFPATGSALESYVVPGMQGPLDAEFKALRAIEHDIQTRVVPSGGRVRGAIGGATCGSCRDAMRDFSRTYDVQVEVTQMYGSIPSSEQKALVASGRARLQGRLLVDAHSGAPLLARDVLGGARAAQVRRDLGASSMGRTFKGMPWRQRSFRLGTPRLPRVSEGSTTDDTTGTATTAAPDC